MNYKDRIRLLAICTCVLVALTFGTVYARMVFQIMPTLTISEDYSDNYLNTASNKQEEFITSYALGFSMGLMDVNKQVFLSYSPTYRDYKNLNDRDGLAHIISVDGEFQPTKFTALEAQLYYDGNSDNYEGEQREHKASLSGTTDIKKNTQLTYGHTYRDLFEEQLRTGEYKEHTVNTTELGLSHQYGKKDILDVTFIFESDIYEVTDDDEYKKFEPDATLSYWFSPKNGMETSFGYLKKDFHDDFDDLETYAGHLRYIRNVSKTLDWFAKYRHSYSDTQDYTHHIFHPSVGVDWDITEDAGVTLGVGVLFHEWSNDNDDDPDPFLELNAFKRFDFSPRTSLTVTGVSDYSSSDDDASSLGYNTSYKVGAEFDHQLLKKLSSSIFGSYQRIEFRETASDRTDDTATLGAGLSWTPLKWLALNLNYSFNDYNTTSSSRDDYQENQVFFSIGFIPETPIRSDKGISRDVFDSRMFTKNNNWSH